MAIEEDREKNGFIITSHFGVMIQLEQIITINIIVPLFLNRYIK